MVFTSAGAEFMAMFLAGSQDIPKYLGLGTGSGYVNSGNNVLVTEAFTGDRISYTTRDHLTTPRFVTWVFDKSAPALSGLQITEFGVFHTSGVSTGSLFNREGFPAITFDGGQELQIEISFEAFV